MSEKEKAINLQDLVYVRQYIDKKHKVLTDDLASSLQTTKEELNNEINENLTKDINAIRDDLNDNVKTDIHNLNTAVENIENGTTEVGSATVAKYASEDTSKGTIEDRLNKILPVTSGASGFAFGQINTNRISKQGTHVIVDIDIATRDDESGKDPIALYNNPVATLPEGFRPRAIATAGYAYLRMLAGTFYYSSWLARVKIDENGQIWLVDDSGNGGYTVTRYAFKIGFEIPQA